MLSRWLPFLFEEHKDFPVELIEQAKQIATIDEPRKNALISQLVQNFPQLDQEAQAEAYKHVTEAFRVLAEDHVTAVRVALSSALKDVAKIPPNIARKLANDAEREVAEPILRFCMSLSEQDLLELISLYPEQWQTEVIAGRKRLSGPVSHAISSTKNILAHRALLGNDGAIIEQRSLQLFHGNADYKDILVARAALRRRLKREWMQVTERALYVFLRGQAHLDKQTTKQVMRATYERMQTQEQIKATSGVQNEEQIRDALMLGENEIVIKALSQRAAIHVSTVRRMIEAGSGRAVIALCIRADVSLRLGVLIQQRLSRLPPAKIVYPRSDDSLPMTEEELRWQYEFFGISL
jgi:hypothetical protein